MLNQANEEKPPQRNTCSLQWFCEQTQYRGDNHTAEGVSLKNNIPSTNVLLSVSGPLLWFRNYIWSFWVTPEIRPHCVAVTPLI